MNSTGKFLVSALLIHAANLKKIGDTQPAIEIPRGAVPTSKIPAQPMTANK